MIAWTGHISDVWGRKWLIVWGMWIQGAGICIIAVGEIFLTFAAGNLLLGVGTAMVYPTLLATIADVAHPTWRASSVGIYRLWRDLGYAAGALIAGIAADALGIRPAIGIVAAMTVASGLIVAIRQRETARQIVSRGLN